MESESLGARARFSQQALGCRGGGCSAQTPDWLGEPAAGLLGWEVLSAATGKEKRRPIGFNSGSSLERSLFCLCFLISRVTSKGLVFPLHVLLILKCCAMGRMRVCVCVCVPALSLGTPLSGEPKTHFLFSGIHFNNLKYLVARCIREALSLMRAAKISIPPPTPQCVCMYLCPRASCCLFVNSFVFTLPSKSG